MTSVVHVAVPALEPAVDLLVHSTNCTAATAESANMRKTIQHVKAFQD